MPYHIAFLGTGIMGAPMAANLMTVERNLGHRIAP
jgi:3-hydroxyisobutyrate dehydrogenase-like beta-hydroxyacid dehydrogenase